MKASELLTELGDKPAAYQVTFSNNNAVVIESPDLGLRVEFEIGKFYDLWIIFSVNNYTGIQPSRHAVAILSTVQDIISKNLKSIVNDLRQTSPIWTVNFDADEPSRRKLYDRVVPLISRLLGEEWKFSGKNTLYGSKKYTWTNH